MHRTRYNARMAVLQKDKVKRQVFVTSGKVEGRKQAEKGKGGKKDEKTYSAFFKTEKVSGLEPA